MLNVLLLSRHGRLAASTRYRFCQYLPYLKAQGITVTEAPLLDDNYLRTLYAEGKRTAGSYFLKVYSERLRYLLKTATYDLVWIHTEALPWLPGWIEQFLLGQRTPYVAEYDDAWFHRYDQHPSLFVRQLLKNKIDRVMKQAALVVAGNEYIAARAAAAGARKIEIVPTVIDLATYPLSPQPHNERFTIGWVGSPPTARHLKSIHPALKLICQEGNAQVVAVGAGSLQLEGVNLQAKVWQEQTEVQEIQRFDVGIMPLIDSVFERGKCGFKLIQYMACARPVIASPVGVNQQLVRDGDNGFQATTTEEWLAAFRKLRDHAELRPHLGAAGRKQVESSYCLQVTAPKLTRLLYDAAS
jgi:glycosyltransferase involved in cell wall biosynthesis